MNLHSPSKTISLLILGSVFSDCVVFYGDWVFRERHTRAFLTRLASSYFRHVAVTQLILYDHRIPRRTDLPENRHCYKLNS